MKFLKFIIFFIILSSVAIIFLPSIEKLKFKNETIKFFKSEKSITKIQSAISDLGIFITYSDNSWIAIQYADSHTILGWSLAIACTSDGNLYQSDFHFCGRFKAYRLAKKKQDEENLELNKSGNEKINYTKTFTDINSIVNAKTLKEAKEELESIGFKKI